MSLLTIPQWDEGSPGDSDGEESACNAGDLGWKDPLEERMATLSSILAWRIFMDRSLAGYSSWGHEESDVTESLSTHAHRVG